MPEACNLSDHRNVWQSLQNLIRAQKTLSLATVSDEGDADIGYAPFVLDEHGRFYIYVSELAAHTRHLSRHSRASIMLIRAEAESSNPFARERAIFQCKADFISRNDPAFGLNMEALQQRFGAIVELLRSLNDFHLVQLTPENGRYIEGFGRAFAIDLVKESLTPIRP